MRALVTGGAHRLGKSMVSFLAEKGWNVIVHANRSLSDALLLVDELKRRYSTQQFAAEQHDLVKWEKSGDFIDSTIKKYGSIDLLINNASRYSSGSLFNTSGELLHEMNAIHYFSPLMMSKAICAQSIDSMIVNILDAAIVNNETNYSAYLLAKKNLAELTKMAALQWAAKCRVNGLAPGPVLPVEGNPSDFFDQVVDKTPLKKAVSLEAINSSLQYLIENNNVSGQILFCDSGYHLL